MMVFFGARPGKILIWQKFSLTCEFDFKAYTYTPINLKFVFEKMKFKVLHFIFDLILFANDQGSVKMRLACSKAFLLINYYDRRF